MGRHERAIRNRFPEPGTGLAGGQRPAPGRRPTGSPASRAAIIAAQKAFQAKLYDAGFAGITWPREYGGQGLTNAEQIAFSQEARDYALPVGAFVIGLGMPGPTILELGTEAQKQRYLPPMLRGEEIWCQLFSEPGAGRTCASLQTSAVRDGDEWVLNGQKVWTSGAQYSDFGAIIARTDPTVPKHNGITMFIVDMHAPGVTVRPLKVATGASPFNEVFFDNVRLPADAVINKVNDGWARRRRHAAQRAGHHRHLAAPRTSPLAYDSLSELAARLGPATTQGTAGGWPGSTPASGPSGSSGSCCARRPWPGATPARAARRPSWPARCSDCAPQVAAERARPGGGRADQRGRAGRSSPRSSASRPVPSPAAATRSSATSSASASSACPRTPASTAAPRSTSCASAP